MNDHSASDQVREKRAEGLLLFEKMLQGQPGHTDSADISELAEKIKGLIRSQRLLNDSNGNGKIEE